MGLFDWFDGTSQCFEKAMVVSYVTFAGLKYAAKPEPSLYAKGEPHSVLNKKQLSHTQPTHCLPLRHIHVQKENPIDSQTEVTSLQFTMVHVSELLRFAYDPKLAHTLVRTHKTTNSGH